jgi:hypothetical protein
MAQFRDFLIEEGIPPREDQIDLMLPVLRREAAEELKTVRLKRMIKGVSTDTGDAFKRLGPMPTLRSPGKDAEHPAESLLERPVVLNWYPKIQALRSSGVDERGTPRATPYLRHRLRSSLFRAGGFQGGAKLV